MKPVISNGHVVTIHCHLTFADDSVAPAFGSRRLVYLHGAKNIDPELERQLTGRKVGDTVTIPGQQIHFHAAGIDVRPATPEEQQQGRVDGPGGPVGAGARVAARVAGIAHRLESASDVLPDPYREVITLSRIAKLSRAEVAAKMGLTEAAVREMLPRALVALAAALRRDG